MVIHLKGGQIAYQEAQEERRKPFMTMLLISSILLKFEMRVITF
jgi:hypothetical protein